MIEVQNKPAIIIEQQVDVEASLARIGLTVDGIVRIAQAASFARREYLLGIDAANYPGTMAYHAGVRSLRLETLPHGWVQDKFRNIEVIVNHRLGVMVGFQNVDRACAAIEPQAISRRGEATKQLVRTPHMESLFLDAKTPSVRHTGAFPSVWFVCVAANEYLIQAEVSRPKPFEGDYFEGFDERIFVVNEHIDGEPEVLVDSAAYEEIDDLDIVITKKTNGSF